MHHVDCFSRSLSLPNHKTNIAAEHVLAVAEDTANDLNIISSIRSDVQKATQAKTDSKSCIAFLCKKISGNKKLVISRSVRWRVTRWSHDTQTTLERKDHIKNTETLLI
ncbi:unnamed protein product [Ceratitis capitata]|uniref:(Mediterranean fruit fly) hypothetical protein n=1 Tax=Ceratitis capitata TaxID=7213 RepID=A0A811UP14_CERCA|nr:unnamed protein product [Ceratitis capitata]